MQDYGLHLKMGNALNIMSSTVRMLKVFLVLQPEQEYVRSIIHQLLTLLYWKGLEDELPFWDAFVKNPAIFNEEPIEVSFSLLGRSMEHDPLRNDRLHVQNKYRGVRQYLDLKGDYATEFMDKDTMKSVNGRKDMKKETTRLPQTKNWILEMIKKARYNQYSPYASGLAFKSSYHASLNSVNPAVVGNNLLRMYSGDATSVLQAHKAYYVSQIENDWAVHTFSSTFDFMGREPGVALGNFAPAHQIIVPRQAAPAAREAKRARHDVADGGHRRQAKRGKRADLSGDDSPAQHESSDDDQHGRNDSNAAISQHIIRVAAASKAAASDPERFKNQLAAADQPGKDRFEALLAAWYDEHGDEKIIPSADYQALVDQAIHEEALAGGGRRGRAAKSVAADAIKNLTDDVDERQYAKALHRSRNHHG